VADPELHDVVGKIHDAMTEKKILLIIPELGMGGAQRTLSKLSVELARYHKVWVVIFNRAGGIAYIHGGELLSLEVGGGGSFFAKLNCFRKRIARLKQIKKDIRPDVSISFLEGADYINVLSAVGEAIVISVRGSKFHDETIRGNFGWLRTRVLIPWLYKRATLIVTVNNGIREELTNGYDLRKTAVRTIGNFYDMGEINTKSSESKPENLLQLYRDPVLITTGRLAPEKGLKSIIKVFHRLRQLNIAIKLVVVGDGPMLSELTALCTALKLNSEIGLDFKKPPDVLFAGNQSNVFKFLNGATLYLMNSSSEGFPNGMAEAMACHIPVASADCPYGPREILAPDIPYSKQIDRPYVAESGVLMPVIKTDSDIDAWVVTLKKLLLDKKQMAHLGEKGFERIKAFDQNRIMPQWLEVVGG
jgi:glycosyltransferase involved in cell wall biosynthesis